MTDAVDLESERERRALESELAGRYRLERELGRGAMSFVYLAWDLRHDRPVALKALRAEIASAIGPVRFSREIHIVAQLVHPNIVGLIDSGVAESGSDAPPIPWFVMPYVEGESLRQRLRREAQLPVDEAIRIASDVAEALEYAHHHNIVHRDIKPENILLSGGQAMVADFGVARLVAASDPGLSSSAGIAVGTPYYMSPEQWAAEPNLDGRSDLYSLACVVYEMLSGEPPFTGATAETIRARHRSQPVPSLHIARPSLPEYVEATLERALAKAPADRFRTVTEFTTALQKGELPPMTRRRRGLQVLAATDSLAAEIVRLVRRAIGR